MPEGSPRVQWFFQTLSLWQFGTMTGVILDTISPSSGRQALKTF